VASLLDVVEDQQHVGATGPNQSTAPLKFVEPLNGLFLIDDTKDSDATNDHGKAADKAPTKVEKPLVTSPAPGPGLINPNSQVRMRELLSEKNLTGAKATEFAQFIIGKDKPDSEAEVQQLIEALELQ
jgi:hypothetical protein